MMKEIKIGFSTLFNTDNMILMKTIEDKYFDLAIVDPPYGHGVDRIKSDNKKWGRGLCGGGGYGRIMWNDKPPTEEYFTELFRISKNQIIWGGNYFKLPLSRGWIVWDKRTENFSNDFADGELAWTSFDTPLRIFRFMWNGLFQENMKDKEKRIHPTQKPVRLYEWLLSNYTKEGDKILDTHLGSGSIAIACNNKGYELTVYEIDEKYFESACKRIQKVWDKDKGGFGLQAHKLMK